MELYGKVPGSSPDDVRQGGVLDHAAAIATHFGFLFTALVGRKAPVAHQVDNAPAAAKEVTPANIIMPTGALKESWDLLIMTLIFYSAASIPIRVCFDVHAEGAVWAFETGMSIIFMIDVGFAFNTAYMKDGVWIYDRGQIARNYLLGWFWIDFPSALPVELLEVYTTVVQHASDSEAKQLETLATLRILRMFRLFRLLRLLKIKEYITRIEEVRAPPSPNGAVPPALPAATAWLASLPDAPPDPPD